MNWRDHGFDFDKPVVTDQTVWRIAVQPAVEKTAVSDLLEKLVFVGDSSQRLLFMSAFGVLVAESDFCLLPVQALKGDLPLLAAGSIDRANAT